VNSDGPSFCRIARSYRVLEKLAFGEGLQKVRVAHLSALATAEEVLVLGEGNGRFLKDLLRRNAVSRVTVVDASPVMIGLIRKYLLKTDLSRAKFITGDVLTLSWSRASFDAVVTPFFLDCFDKHSLIAFLPRVAGALKPKGRWLLADFVEPEALGGVRCIFNACILRGLYTFFRATCGIEARRVVDPLPILEKCGLRILDRRDFRGGLLRSLVLEKP
tara:strand:- start:257 stop:910 length:654 start_codon:yes stop_codon:yes gene_type:complete